MDLNEEDLIFEVQSRPALYDRTLTSYKNTNKREDLWKEVATVLQSDVNLCKKRWRSLRDCFIKNYRLIKMTSSGAAGGRKKRWPFYSLLEFLIPHVETKESIGNYSADSPKERQEQTKVEDSSEQLQPQTDIEQPQEKLAKKVPEKSSYKWPKRPVDSTEKKLLEVILQKRDPNESFLMSLLPSLQRLNPRKNAEARIKLQQVLYDIEFNDPEEGSSCPNCAHPSPNFATSTPPSVSSNNR